MKKKRRKKCQQQKKKPKTKIYHIHDLKFMGVTNNAQCSVVFCYTATATLSLQKGMRNYGTSCGFG